MSAPHLAPLLSTTLVLFLTLVPGAVDGAAESPELRTLREALARSDTVAAAPLMATVRKAMPDDPGVALLEARFEDQQARQMRQVSTPPGQVLLTAPGLWAAPSTHPEYQWDPLRQAKALAAHQRACALAPDDLEVRSALALFLADSIAGPAMHAQLAWFGVNLGRPGAGEAAERIAARLERTGSYERALEWWTVIARGRPDPTTTLRRLVVLAQTGHTLEAIEGLDAVDSLAARRLALGLCLRRGDLTGAQKRVGSLRAAAGDPDLLLTPVLARLSAGPDLGDLSGTLDGTVSSVPSAMGKALKDLGSTLSVEQHLAQAQRLRKEGPLEAAWVHAARAQAAGARPFVVAHLRSQLAREANDVLADLGFLELARKSALPLDSAALRELESDESWFAVGQFYFHRWLCFAARECWKRAPTPPDRDARLAFHFGRIHEELGQPEQAPPWFVKCAALPGPLKWVAKAKAKLSTPSGLPISAASPSR